MDEHQSPVFAGTRIKFERKASTWTTLVHAGVAPRGPYRSSGNRAGGRPDCHGDAGKRGIQSAMIGSVAEAVLRHASSPGLTAGRGASHRSIAVFPGALSRLHEVGARRPDGGGRSPGPVSGRHPVGSGNRIGRLSSPKADSDCPGRGFQPSAVDGDRDNGPVRQVSSIQAASSGRSALVTWGANDGWESRIRTLHQGCSDAWLRGIHRRRPP